MAQTKLIRCDGCEAETEVNLDTVTSSFYHTTVCVGSWSKQFDLCPKCHTRLLDAADPTGWPRMPKDVPYRAA